jgi:hypothetical protein
MADSQTSAEFDRAGRHERTILSPDQSKRSTKLSRATAGTLPAHRKCPHAITIEIQN